MYKEVQAITTQPLLRSMLKMMKFMNATRNAPSILLDSIAVVMRESFNMKKILFGAGCFWGVEETFRKIKGVNETQVGYSGGEKPHPTYQDVCTGETGHAEVVLVEYDPQKISLEELLEQFWQIHDPTSMNKQGPDVGTQYRSAVYFYSVDQKITIDECKAKQQQHHHRPIVTEVAPASSFWRAEEYHQCYLEKNGLGQCQK